MHFTYLQDDIRVNDKLTANIGLRYEYASPMTEASNALTWRCRNIPAHTPPLPANFVKPSIMDYPFIDG